MKTSVFSKKITFFTWLFFIAVSAALFYSNFIASNKINSDISSILPLEQQQAAELNQVFNQLASKSVIWMLKSKDSSELLAAAQLIEEALESSDELLLQTNDTDGFENLYRLLIESPAAFLSSKDREFLQKNAHQSLTQSRIQQLFSPLSTIDSNRLRQDPLQLAENYFKEFSSRFESNIRYGAYLGYENNGWHYLLMNVELDGSPFDLNIQESYLQQLSGLNISLAPKNIQLLQLGVIGFAAHETQQGLFEAQVIGLGSLLAIFLLVTLIFRSFVPLLLISMVIGISVLIALALSALLFSDIHILSILVGASLIGISVDYVFHYFAKNTLYSQQLAAQKILKPVSLGMLTSILGYLALYFSGLVVLKQIAVISSIGLFAAYVTTLVILPRIKFDLSSGSRNKSSVFDGLNKLFSGAFYKKFTITTSVIILLVGAIKLPSIVFSDDLELLHASPEYLQRQQLEIESLVKESQAGLNLVVKAGSLQNLLESLEGYSSFFEQQIEKDKIEAVISPHQFLNSIQSQKENNSQLLAWLSSDDINAYLDLIELKERSALIEKFSTPKYVSMKDVESTPFKNFINQMLIVSEERKYYGLIKLVGVQDAKPFIQLAQENTNVLMLDSKASFSGFLSKVRTSSMELVAFAYLLILVILLVFYGFRLGWLIFLAPLCAAVFAILFASAIGQALNVFHIVALTLVLGIGIDYTIFYASTNDDNQPDMVLAISCSMISTLLAFGLMSLSQTPAVAGFGTIVLVGIIVAYMLSPMAKGHNQ